MISWPRRHQAALARARTAAPVVIDPACVVVFLGAVWINDALMLAARDAHAAGARCVYLLYDLTPVLETGHTAAVNKLFDRYLALVAQTASRVPAISRSSRTDFEAYCRDHDWAAPAGGVTGLPCGITPGQFDTAASPWPRPYALLVGTVESRKNHLLALRAWARLIDAGRTRCGAGPRLRGQAGLARRRVPRRVRAHARTRRQGERAVVGHLRRRAGPLLRPRRVHGVPVALRGLGPAGVGEPRLREAAGGGLQLLAPGGGRRPGRLLRLRRPGRLRRGAPSPRARPRRPTPARRSASRSRGSHRSRGRMSHRSCSTRWPRPPQRK